MQLVLLSGGSGKRLWPLSNNARSKLFLPLLEKEDGTMESMVQRVVRQARLANFTEDITLATNASQQDIIVNQLGDSVNLVTEPERRDTFPAIALAASYLSLEKKCSDDEVVVIMPCDPYTELGYFETICKMVAYRVLDDSYYVDGRHSLTKSITLKEGKNINFQIHHHRSETWTFVQGEGFFVLDGKEQKVKVGDTVVIPVEHGHAIKSHTELTFIEVQSGNPLIEEDIERTEWVWSELL